MLDERQSHEGDIRAARGSWLAARGSWLVARGSRLVARGSRLEYRTRFLAAPPAGILEQKRDCSQSSAFSVAGPNLWNTLPLEIMKSGNILNSFK